MSNLQRETLQTLSGAAARLYIYLLWNGGDMSQKSEAMRVTGISDYRTIQKGYRELVDKGLFDPEIATVSLPFVSPVVPAFPASEASGIIPDSVKITDPTSGIITDSGIITEVTSGIIPDSGIIPTTVTDTSGIITEVSADAEEDTLLLLSDAVAAADALPGDGDERNPHSNFQQRRKAQLVLLPRIWSSFFPEQPPLNPLTAKSFLALARGQATTVFEGLQQAHEKCAQYPLAYTKKVLEALATRPAQSSQSQAQPAPRGSWQSAFDLGTERPVTPEQRREWDRMQLIAQRMGWEDDDD